ncbi:hypothetical protein KKH30_01130, partial [Candidatus Micrarchaeota archaeon]|nr:hypothetical protein [Candidatus Micrarchaeota archaeon]MBU1939345.1 hypothetical protein [Candidatus Micrarchaeota archaeon]
MPRIFTLDLHTHIAEQKADIEKCWKRAQAVGLDGIAITEHANLDPENAYNRVLEKKPKEMLLIPGIELNTQYGHMLAYGKDEGVFKKKELLKKDVKIKKLIEISREREILIGVAHPWGFNYDSVGYSYGLKNIEDLVIREHIGVEVYNGMIGHLSNFIYDSNWINKPRNFLDFLEKNRVARRVWISKLSGGIKRRVDEQSLDVIKRCANAVELGDKARFVTAGSDAHSADRIGTGIIKLKSQRDELDNESFIEEIQHKENVIWSGPLVNEIRDGVFEKVDDPLTSREIVQGLKYATKKTVGG